MSMRKNRFGFRFQFKHIVPLVLVWLFGGIAANAIMQTDTLEQLRDFQIIADGEGWVLVGNELFWTSNNGISWENISPGDQSVINSAFFINPSYGLVVTTEQSPNDSVVYHLNITMDQGAHWEVREIVRYNVKDPWAVGSSIHIFFLDENIGWIVFKKATSSNFNIGKLFHTRDGGKNWQESPTPLGEEIIFLNEDVGFMSGGLYDQLLYRTVDSGQTWKAFDPSPNVAAKVQLPIVSLTANGYLTALETKDETKTLKIFETSDAGKTWEAIQGIELGNNPVESYLFAGIKEQLLISMGDELIIVDLISNQVNRAHNEITGTFSKIGIIESGVGWAITNDFYCESQEYPATCTMIRELVYTDAGGENWSKIETPLVQGFSTALPEYDAIQPDVELLPRTSFLRTQGFDMCEIASLPSLQTWKNYSPYSVVNLYIGGVARGCPNDNLTGLPDAKNFVKDLSIQGWKFIPTWVGHQAACSDFSIKMPYNTGNAESLGEGNASDAARIAMKLGLGEDETQSGTVIYYDLEAFDANVPGCLEAAKSFINGWVQYLHSKGIMAGLYGSTCGSHLSEFATIPNPPDVIWPAAWSSPYIYKSSVDVFGLTCLSDSLWGNQKRIRQYTGGHNETWGGVLMNVDLNVIDGVVADISKFVGVPTANLENASFESGVIAPWSINLNESACTWSIANSVPAWNGSSYLTIAKSLSQPECTGVSQSISLLPSQGDRYRFAVWVRSSTPSDSRSIRLQIEGEGAVPESTNQKYSGIPDEWTCLEVEHTIGSGNLTGLKVEILLEDNDGIDMLVDDARLSLNTANLCPPVLLPSGTSASNATASDHIVVNWDTVPGATYYKVFRASSRFGSKTNIGQTIDTYWYDFGGNFLDVYFYWIKACDAGRCSLYSRADAGSFSSPFLDFKDDFEHGTTARWNAKINTSSNIYPCGLNPISGNYSLCLNAASPSNAFLVHNLPSPTNMLNVSFKLDPNSASLSPRIHTILRTQGDGLIAFDVQLQKASGQYRIRLRAHDNGVLVPSEWIMIPDAPSTLTARWNSSVGHLRAINTFREASLLLNGEEIIKLAGLNNENVEIDRILFGEIVSNNTPGSGIFLLDDFKTQGPYYLRPISP